MNGYQPTDNLSWLRFCVIFVVLVAKFWDTVSNLFVFFLQYYFQLIIQLLSFHLMLCTRTFPEVCRLWLLIIFVRFDVVTFEFMPWVQHLCHCWQHDCNRLFGIACRTVSYCSWFSWTFWQWCHHRCDFMLGNNKTSQRTKTEVRTLQDYVHICNGQQFLLSMFVGEELRHRLCRG